MSQDKIVNLTAAFNEETIKTKDVFRILPSGWDDEGLQYSINGNLRALAPVINKSGDKKDNWAFIALQTGDFDVRVQAKSRATGQPVGAAETFKIHVRP